jgi:hypothetical protein
VVNDQVFGLSATGWLDTLHLLDIVTRLPTGVTEIYLHPCVGNEELAALVDRRVRAAVAASGAVCGGYKDLHSLPARPG